MKINEVLEKVANNKISIEKAYQKMFKPVSNKKAHFLRLRIKIKNKFLMSCFINLLFLFPIPISLLRVIFKKVDKEIHELFPLTIYEAIEVFGVKKVVVEVIDSEGTKIKIKTM